MLWSVRHKMNDLETTKRPSGLRGRDLLDTPIWNKGTAFDDRERTALSLHGLLPSRVESLPEQVRRAYHAFRTKDTDLERHIYLRRLQDSNETLFYRLMLEHVEEMMPTIYTPTVGLACQRFGEICHRPRGLVVSYRYAVLIDALDCPALGHPATIRAAARTVTLTTPNDVFLDAVQRDKKIFGSVSITSWTKE